MLSDALKILNPSFDEDYDFDQAFMDATPIAQSFLNRYLARYKAEVTAEAKFLAAYQGSADKRYVVLERFIPAGRQVERLKDLLFIVFYDKDKDQWTLRTVKEERGAYSSRKALPSNWGAKSDNELQAVSGVEDALYCHASLWIAGAKSKEGILSMLRLALENEEDQPS